MRIRLLDPPDFLVDVPVTVVRIVDVVGAAIRADVVLDHQMGRSDVAAPFYADSPQRSPLAKRRPAAMASAGLLTTTSLAASTLERGKHAAKAVMSAVATHR